jgi:hypothetical protein
MTSVVVIVLDFNREISLLMLSCAVHLFFLIPRSEKFLVVHSSWPDYSGEFSFWPRPSLVFFLYGKELQSGSAVSSRSFASLSPRTKFPFCVSRLCRVCSGLQPHRSVARVAPSTDFPVRVPSAPDLRNSFSLLRFFYLRSPARSFSAPLDFFARICSAPFHFA